MPTIAEMRAILGLGPEVPDEEVVQLYLEWLADAEPVDLLSLADVKAHLRVDHDDEDTLITAYIAAAIDHLDGEDGWLGRAVKRRRFLHRQRGFPFARVRLPYPPVTQIVHVRTFDAAGIATDIDPSFYELVRDRILQPRFGASWPTPGGLGDNVEISYVAGYAELPPAMRAALLLMVGDLYAARESFVTGTIATKVPMSTTVENLLQPFRVYAL